MFEAKARPESLILQLVRREEHLPEAKPNRKIAEPGKAHQSVSNHWGRDYVKFAVPCATPLDSAT